MATISFIPGQGNQRPKAHVRLNNAAEGPIVLSMKEACRFWGEIGTHLYLFDASLNILESKKDGDAAVLQHTLPERGFDMEISQNTWGLTNGQGTGLLVRLYLASLGCEPPARFPNVNQVCLGGRNRYALDFSQVTVEKAKPGTATVLTLRKAAPDGGPIYIHLYHPEKAGAESFVLVETAPAQPGYNRTVQQEFAMPRAQVLALVRELLSRALAGCVPEALNVDL